MSSRITPYLCTEIVDQGLALRECDFFEEVPVLEDDDVVDARLVPGAIRALRVLLRDRRVGLGEA